MHWLIPAEPSYDHSKSFADFGYIDWRQGKIKYAVDDIVYIYITRPNQRIEYKCIVEKTNQKGSDIDDDEEYWINKSKKKPLSSDDLFVKLSLLKKVDNSFLHLDFLIENGLKTASRGAKKLEGDLLDYIGSNFHDSLSGYQMLLDERVQKSLSKSDIQRKKDLALADKKPKYRMVIAKVYDRNPDVVVEVLKRASGICEHCENKAPFIKATNGDPYLEVHHKILLSKGGDDTVENAMALCPNCHRYKHYGMDA